MFAWPKLRQELDLMPGPTLSDGQPSWTLHDPVRNLFFRIDWSTLEVLQRWDMADPERIALDISEQTTLHLTVQDVLAVVQHMVHNQLVLADTPQTTEKLAQQWFKLQGTPWKWLLHHYLFFRIPLWRPDAWLGRCLPLARAPMRRVPTGSRRPRLPSASTRRGPWAQTRAASTPAASATARSTSPSPARRVPPPQQRLHPAQLAAAVHLRLVGQAELVLAAGLAQVGRLLAQRLELLERPPRQVEPHDQRVEKILLEIQAALAFAVGASVTSRCRDPKGWSRCTAR